MPQTTAQQVLQLVREQGMVPGADHAPRICSGSTGGDRSNALAAGVEEHPSGSRSLRVYCPDNTVADCFKFCNKIGLDVAIEALQSCRKKRLSR